MPEASSRSERHPEDNRGMNNSGSEEQRCVAAASVCTSDGRMLEGPLSVTVPGPAALSVADAEVDEEPGAKLAFAVTLNTVRILDAGAVLATHPRSFDRGQQIEDPAHIEELERHKRLAREHRATDRLHHAAPSAKALFVAAAQPPREAAHH